MGFVGDSSDWDCDSDGDTIVLVWKVVGCEGNALGVDIGVEGGVIIESDSAAADTGTVAVAIG